MADHIQAKHCTREALLREADSGLLGICLRVDDYGGRDDVLPSSLAPIRTGVRWDLLSRSLGRIDGYHPMTIFLYRQLAILTK